MLLETFALNCGVLLANVHDIRVMNLNFLPVTFEIVIRNIDFHDVSPKITG